MSARPGPTHFPAVTELHVRVELLGHFRVIIDEREVPNAAWRRASGAALVKLLALTDGHRLHREQVMEALWPETSPESAAANFRKAVHFARRALGVPAAIHLQNEVVGLAPESDLVIDTEVFERDAKMAVKSHEPAACARAAEEYDELLPDDRYVLWTEEPRERLRQLYQRTLRAGGLWDQLLEHDPADEEAQRAVMQAALDAGNRGEVIRQFQRLRERLRVDLGVGPAKATVALYERALAGASPELPSVADRVRGSLAWGIIHLHSGEFAKAEAIAREARQLALGAGLGREMGEASALFGLAAHMQGRWPELFRIEFGEWVRGGHGGTMYVLDGHLCLAEFCLCGARGHEEIARGVRELRGLAQESGDVPGLALTALVLGEAELFSGRMDEAESLLEEALRLYEKAHAAAGTVVALQRLAEVALARGQKYRANRYAQRGFRIANESWLSPHLLMRLQAIAVQTAGTRAKLSDAISRGDTWLAQGNMCQPCSMGFRVASAVALAESGELDQASRRLDETERLAGMWNGGPWVAAVWEARGVHRNAQGSHEQAAALFREAAERYGALGRPGDRARCLTRAAAAASA